MSAPDQEQALLAELATIFRRVLRDENFAIEPGMETGAHPNWDSFANVELLLGCEERWCLQFSASEIDAIRSVNDLLRAIQRKRLG